MKKILTLTAIAFLWGTSSFAAVDADTIAAKFVADGFTNLDITQKDGGWLVKAMKDGKILQFMVDGVSGEAVAIDGATDGKVGLAGTGESGEGTDDSEGKDDGQAEDGGSDDDED